MSTIIATCNCQHYEQDKMHGKGKRVKNLTDKSKTSKMYRCTVCESLQSH